jgi:hypothetical protein
LTGEGERGGEVEKMDEEKKTFIGKALKKAGELLDNAPSEQALLVEYQSCLEAMNSTSLNFWTLSSIFIGFSAVLIGGLVYGLFSNDILLGHITEYIFNGVRSNKLAFVGTVTWILVIIFTLITYFIWSWMKRVQFLAKIHYERMRDIEYILGMRGCWRIHGIDKWDLKKEDFDSNEINEQQKQMLYQYKQKRWWQNRRNDPFFGFEKGSGIKHHKGIFIMMFILWVILLGFSLYLLFDTNRVVFWLLTAVSVIWLIFLSIQIYRKFFKQYERTQP